MRYSGLKPPTWAKLDGVDVTLVRARDRLKPGNWCNEQGTIYFNPPEGKKIEELDVESVTRPNGVQLNGETSHIVIKNLTAKYFHNDGYNVHGRVKDAVFLNCLESKGTAWHTVLR